METGFLLDIFQRSLNGKAVIYCLGRLENGATFGLVEQRLRPYFFIRASDLDKARPLIEGSKVDWADSVFCTMDREATVQLHADHEGPLRRLAEKLEEHGVRTFEADLPLTRRYLINRSVTGPVLIDGIWQTGREVDWITVNPELSPTDWEPELLSLSLDIETTPEADKVTAISLVAGDLEEVHILGQPDCNDPGHLYSHPTEQELLRVFRKRVREIDPDIITGWNVIDFDLRVLLKRFDALGIDKCLGRTDEESRFREGTRWGGSRVRMSGRQVLDALQLVRHIPQRFDNYKLGTVAQAMLGRGKLLHDSDKSMPETIMDAYENDRETFAEYCLEDSRLIRDILAKTDLLKLTLRRSILTGLQLERAWGSVAAFEFLYLTKLHERSIVAATGSEDPEAGGSAPGGWVLSPKAGLHRNIVVFDFKSLYPSIIRTFNIDPLARIHAEGRNDECLIIAPNSARFDREQGILPEMLGVFFERRAAAKAAGDDLASYTYKIVMNSFYGVMGTKSCRFADHRLAGAITTFGHYLLKWCRDYLEERGCTILYGDTDSLFIDMHLPDEVDVEIATGTAMKLCAEANDVLRKHVRDEYRLDSYLELEFEKYYCRFLLPPSRGQTEKGRAKGYAGLLVEGEEERVDIIGMEAVRRDWTDMAHNFQRELFDLLFHDADGRTIETLVSDTIRDLRAAKLDELLVYRKALRKPVERYTKSTPPHVKAAQLLPGKASGVIQYLMTVHGPQPVGYVKSPLDYEHYIQKQIAPIVRAIENFCDADMTSAVTGEQWLF